MIELNMKFDDSFFDEEVRCGYTVSSKMKKVWAVELDLLNELLKVCKKHNISIMAASGTMLGAVRHKGFIPWDDDIDLIMTREQYNKLCEIANDEFKHPYFFQTEYTDKGSMRGHAQLRNSNTTGILEYEGAYVKFNQGIFIDIFPLDTVIDDYKLLKRQSRMVKLFKLMASKLYKFTEGYDVIEHTLKRQLIHPFAIILNKIYSYDKWYRRFEKTCSMYNDKDTEFFSSLSFKFDEKRHYKYKKDYKNLIEMDFEMLKIPVAEGYDHALTQEYGNWKEFEIGTSCHGMVIFDTDVSYNEYLKKKIDTINNF